MQLDINAVFKDFFLEYKTEKSLLAFAVVLIGYTYLLDHWGSTGRIFLYGKDMPAIIYPFGLTLALIAFLTIFLRGSWGILKALYYRYWKYPRRNLDKSFYAINFHGKAYILDESKKEHRWISSWQTASDCNFHELWTYVPESLENSLINNTNLITIAGTPIDLKLFKKNGGKIHTRGVAGS